MADILKQVTVVDDSGTAAEFIPRRRAVAKNANGEIILAGDGVKPFGFVTREFAKGERVEVVTDGVVPATIATPTGVEEGAKLACAAYGKLDTGDAGNPVAAIARGDAGAADDVISVRVSDLLSLHEIPA